MSAEDGALQGQGPKPRAPFAPSAGLSLRMAELLACIAKGKVARFSITCDVAMGFKEGGVGVRRSVFIVSMILSFAVALAEFRAEVHGKPTIIGCYIRGFDGINSARCGDK